MFLTTYENALNWNQCSAKLRDKGMKYREASASSRRDKNN
jgi:hypothetical protein